MNKRCMSLTAAIVFAVGVGYALAGTSPIVNRLPISRTPSPHSTGPAEAATGTLCDVEGYKSESADISTPIPIPETDGGPDKLGPLSPIAYVYLPDDGSSIQDVVVDLQISHTWVGDLVGFLVYFENCVTPSALQPGSLEELRSSGEPFVTLLCRQGDDNCDGDGCDAHLSCDNTYRFGDEATYELGTPYCPEGTTPLPGGCYTVSKSSIDKFSTFKDSPKGGCFALFLLDAYVGKDYGTLCAMTVHVKNTGTPPTHELCCINDECVEVEIGQCAHRGGVIVSSCTGCGTPPPTHELCCVNNECFEVEIGQCDHQGGVIVSSCNECGTPPPTHELCCINDECVEVEIGQCAHRGGVIVTSCTECSTHPPTHELCCINDVCTEVEIGQCDHQGGVLVNSCDECGDHGPQTELCCITPVGAVGGQECVEFPVGRCEPLGGTVVDNCEQCNDHGPQTELCCSHGQCTEVAIDTCTGLGGTVVSSCTECGIQPHSPPFRLPPGEGEVELSLSRGDREPVLAPVLPNPFVSTTAVFYALPSAALVRLSVYDASGRLVDRLVERAESPGVHVAEWDGSGHPSGVYFFRLEVGSEVRVRRAILSK